MKRDRNTTVTATFEGVPMTPIQRKAFARDRDHRHTAQTLLDAVHSLRPDDDTEDGFNAMTGFEFLMMEKARDIIHSIWASVEDRRSCELNMSQRYLSEGDKVTVRADIGEPEDSEFPPGGMTARVVATNGSDALVSFTMRENGKRRRFYLLAPERFQTPSFYDGCDVKDDRPLPLGRGENFPSTMTAVYVHCSPDQIVWALDLDEDWRGRMAKSARKAFDKALADCEETMGRERKGIKS